MLLQSLLHSWFNVYTRFTIRITTATITTSAFIRLHQASCILNRWILFNICMDKKKEHDQWSSIFFHELGGLVNEYLDETKYYSLCFGISNHSESKIWYNLAILLFFCWRFMQFSITQHAKIHEHDIHLYNRIEYECARRLHEHCCPEMSIAREQKVIPSWNAWKKKTEFKNVDDYHCEMCPITTKMQLKIE